MGLPTKGSNAHYLLIPLLLLVHAGLCAQETAQSLVDFLRELEARHEVHFTYLDEDVAGLEITHQRNWELEESLRHIEEVTLLRFEEMEAGYYVIRKLESMSVCGQVLDNYARNRMGGATVEILPDDRKIVTDENGYFRLENVSPEATLKIRFLGFLPRYLKVMELKAADGECSRILLAEEVQRLREVIVFPLITSGIESTEEGSTRIRPDEFGILPGLTDADVLQVLQALPGIESYQERVSDLNIRGGTHAENLILWNGIKMYQSGHFFGLISAFQPQLTQEVIAFKNGTPARHGDGVSGMILMNSSEETPEEHSGGGGLNMISADAYGRNPLGSNTGIEWSLRRSYTDVWRSPVYEQYRRRVFQDSELDLQQLGLLEDFYFGDFSTRFYWDIDNQHQFRASVLGIQNRLDSQNVSLGQQSRLNQQNLSIGAELISEWDRRLSSRVLLYQTDYELQANSLDTISDQQLFQKNDVLERKLAVQLTYELSSRSKLTAGYEIMETGIANLTEVSQPPFNSRIKGVIISEGVFGELQFASKGRFFKGRLGLRLNAYENLNTFSRILSEPRFSAHFRLTPHLHLQVQGESKSQVTQQLLDLEQNFLGIEKRRWILSNESSLPVVTSEQFSVGLEYARDEWYGSLSLFSKEVSGISTSTQGFQNFNQFNGEIGGYQVQGLEALINYRNRVHSHWLSYAFNQNTFEFPDLVPQTFPGQQDVRHALSWGSTVSWNRWYFGLGGRWRSGRPYTPAEGVDPVSVPPSIDFGPTNSSRLPSYLRFDASVSYRFPINYRIMASVSASVLNLTNRRNILDRYYRIGEEDQLVQVDNFSLGITPDLSLRVRF